LLHGEVLHNVRKQVLTPRKIFYTFFAGLHPSQQLTKYGGDREAVTGADGDPAVNRLSSLSSGGSTDGQHRDLVATVSDPDSEGGVSQTDLIRVRATTPESNPADLYTKPKHLIGRRTSGDHDGNVANGRRTSSGCC